MIRTGVFVCHCGLNIAGTVDVAEVAAKARGIDGVVYSADYKYMCSDPGQNLIKQAISEHNLNRVVVCSCSPRMHENTFRGACAAGGLNGYLYEHANIREQCSWVHKDRGIATGKAISITSGAVEKVRGDEPLAPIKIPITKRALVVGAGIAGMQAALDIAGAGYETILVDRQSAIGGHMLQLSETFPTLDCAQCTLTPKTVEVGQNKSIKLYMGAELDSLDGVVGNFVAKVRQKPRYIDNDKCTGCGDCTDVCPVTISDSFNKGLCERKAIFKLSPQAVPNAFAIDKRGRAPCKDACPISQSAQGYVALLRQKRYDAAYRVIKDTNPFPGICGRVCNHRCEDSCTRSQVDQAVSIAGLKRFVADWYHSSEHEAPAPCERTKEEKVAVIGAGPAGLTAAQDLVKKGYGVTVFEALPVAGGMMRVGIPAYRLPRPLVEREIADIQALGVEIKTGMRVGKDVSLDQLRAEGYKAFFLAVGAHKGQKLAVEGEDLQGVVEATEFLREINLGRQAELKGRVAVIGGGNTAIDSARTAIRVGASDVSLLYRRTRDEMPAIATEVDAAEHEGIKIGLLTAPVRFIGEGGKVKKVVCQKMELGEPDASGRRRPVPVPGSEFEVEVDTVVLAIGQTPEVDGLGDGLEVNRNGTVVADSMTMATSLEGVFAGGDAVTGPAFLVEAIEAGHNAAESIDRYLMGEELVLPAAKVPVAKLTQEEIQQTFDSGRTSLVARHTVLELPVEERLAGDPFKEVELGFTEEMALAEAERCLNCGICSECGECSRVCQASAVLHDDTEKLHEFNVGAVVAATGFELYNKAMIPEYGAGHLKDVIDGVEFERMLSASGPFSGQVRRPSDGKTPKEVVFIACVGSRDPERGNSHCSKVCCMYTAKHAALLKRRHPDAQAYVFYMDVRSPGKGYEEFVQRAVEESGVMYLRGRVSKLFEEDGKVVVWGADTLSGKKVEVRADLVVLAMAMMPSSSAKKLATTMRIGTDQAGFFTEAHLKLRPVESLTQGIYYAGCSQGPKDISDSVTQASGAAAKVLSLFARPEMVLDPLVAAVEEDLCKGCGICVEQCNYNARYIDPVRRVAVVMEAACQSCGACAAACPNKAATMKNNIPSQMMALVEGLLA